MAKTVTRSLGYDQATSFANPFSTGDDFISPSLNDFKIVSLPGIELPADVQGKTGYQLLSIEALQILIQEKSRDLGVALPPDFDLRLFEELSISSIGKDKRLYFEVASAYGRRLGYLLIALKEGDPPNRAARPVWQTRHWEYWRNIDRIWVGALSVANWERWLFNRLRSCWYNQVSGMWRSIDPHLAAGCLFTARPGFYLKICILRLYLILARRWLSVP